MEEELTRDQRKRLTLLFGGGALVAVLLVVVAIWLLGSEEEAGKPEVRSYTLTEADAAEAETLARFFVEEAGSFGVPPSAVTPATIFGLRNRISEDPTPSIWLSRAAVYSNLRENYIAPGSELDFSDVSSWTDDLFSDHLVTVRTSVGDVSVPSEGFLRDLAVPTVRATVGFTATHTARTQPVTDTTWDGTFQVEATQVNGTLALVLEKVEDGSWKVAAVEDLAHRSLLAIGADPSEDRLPAPSVTATIKADVDLPKPERP